MIYNAAIRFIKFTLLFIKMPNSKIYLNVPFAQKDEAKELGARWDAIKKKWFVPTGKDVTLFARWQTESGVEESPRPKKSSSSSSKSASGAKTHATIENFVAYNGDTPPWD